MMVLFVLPVNAQPIRQAITRDNVDRLEELALLGRGGIYDKVWSPDGARLAVTGPVGVWLYDSADWKALPTRLGDMTYATSSAVFNAAGTQLVTATASGWRVWDVVQNRIVREVAQPRDASIYAMALSPDERLLATALVGATHYDSWAYLQLWDFRTGVELAYWRFEDLFPSFTDLTFSPDGRRVLVATASGPIYSYAVEDMLAQRGGWWVVKHHVPTDGPFVPFSQRIGYAPDGQGYALYQTYTQDSRYRYELRTFPQGDLRVHRTNENYYDVTTLDFNLSSRLLAASGMIGEIELYDIDSGALIATLAGHDATTSLIFDPTGRWLVSYGDGHLLKVWEVATGAEQVISDLHTQFGYRVAFHPNNTLLAFGTEILGGEVQLWDVETQTLIERIPGHGDWTESIAFHPDGTRMATSAGRSCCPRLWDLTLGREVASFNGHPLDKFENIKQVFFTDDGATLAAVGEDGFTTFWNVETGQIIDTAEPDEAVFDWMSWFIYQSRTVISPDGSMMVRATIEGLMITDSQTDVTLAEIRLDGIPFYSLDWSDDGTRIAATGNDGAVHLFGIGY
jgi:WD40 repeat protein